MIPGTPAGAESRITVALKDYYLGRAQSGVDLPDWLFSAEERRAAGGAGNTQRGNRAMDSGRDWSGVPPAQYPSESGDLDTRTSRPRGYSASTTTDPRSAAPSSGTSRFKQMRDAKRGVGGSLDSGGRVKEGTGPGTTDRAVPSSYPYPNAEDNASGYRPRSRAMSDASRRRGTVGGGLPSGPRASSSSSRR